MIGSSSYQGQRPSGQLATVHLDRLFEISQQQRQQAATAAPTTFEQGSSIRQVSPQEDTDFDTPNDV
jgi:hypothetical protein